MTSRAGVMALFMLAATMVMGGPAWSDEKGEGSKSEMAAAAKVTIDQAIKTASKKVSGKVIEAELEQEHGKLVWEVEIVTAGNKVMEVHIDAGTGEVIDVEEEEPEKD